MDIEVTRPAKGWTEWALSFLPGTVVQYFSAAGAPVRARCAGEFWHVVQHSGQPPLRMTGSGLLQDLGDAPSLRILAQA